MHGSGLEQPLGNRPTLVCEFWAGLFVRALSILYEPRNELAHDVIGLMLHEAPQTIGLGAEAAHRLVINIQLHGVRYKLLKRAIAEIEDVSASHLEVFFEMPPIHVVEF